MNIIPVIRCRDFAASLEFYTRILSFDAGEETGFPYRLLFFRGMRLDLSALSGDGEFGSRVLVLVDDVDAVFQSVAARGHDFSRFEGVHRAPVDQTWGMRELYIDDPDGNTVRFAENISAD